MAIWDITNGTRDINKDETHQIDQNSEICSQTKSIDKNKDDQVDNLIKLQAIFVTNKLLDSGEKIK